MKKKMVALCASALTFCSSMTVLTPAIANAEECKGVTERKEVAKDFDNTMRWYESKMNSCDTKKTLDALDAAGGASIVGDFIGRAYPPLGVASGYIGLWAWENQHAFKDCAAAGTGVVFKEVNGAVAECHPQ
jgi:hypothetical protein